MSSSQAAHLSPESRRAKIRAYMKRKNIARREEKSKQLIESNERVQKLQKALQAIEKQRRGTWRECRNTPSKGKQLPKEPGQMVRDRVRLPGDDAVTKALECSEPSDAKNNNAQKGREDQCDHLEGSVEEAASMPQEENKCRLLREEIPPLDTLSQADRSQVLGRAKSKKTIQVTSEKKYSYPGTDVPGCSQFRIREGRTKSSC